MHAHRKENPSFKSRSGEMHMFSGEAAIRDSKAFLRGICFMTGLAPVPVILELRLIWVIRLTVPKFASEELGAESAGLCKEEVSPHKRTTK